MASVIRLIYSNEFHRSRQRRQEDEKIDGHDDDRFNGKNGIHGADDGSIDKIKSVESSDIEQNRLNALALPTVQRRRKERRRRWAR